MLGEKRNPTQNLLGHSHMKFGIKFHGVLISSQGPLWTPDWECQGLQRQRGKRWISFSPESHFIAIDEETSKNPVDFSGHHPAFYGHRWDGEGSYETVLGSWKIYREEKQLNQSLGEEGMTTHSSILAWRIPWTEVPGGLQWGRKEWTLAHFWTSYQYPSFPTVSRVGS